MGAGYDYMDQAMHDQFNWQFLGLLAGLKIIATTLSFVSGTPGGMFAPTLFIGAMLGGAIGGAERHFFPTLTVSTGTYALVGMGVLFAGFLRAPMTSVFMVLEVSGNYSIILPVIIANTFAYLISRSLQPTPIFDLLTRQDGLILPSLEEEREQAVLRVEDAMRPISPAAVLNSGDSVSIALHAMEGTSGASLPGAHEPQRLEHGHARSHSNSRWRRQGGHEPGLNSSRSTLTLSLSGFSAGSGAALRKRDADTACGPPRRPAPTGRQ